MLGTLDLHFPSAPLHLGITRIWLDQGMVMINARGPVSPARVPAGLYLATVLDPKDRVVANWDTEIAADLDLTGPDVQIVVPWKVIS